MIKKIISGGQTGADRAALDVAIEYHVPHGGWIPKGRLTEDGPLPEKYHLKEMPTESYPKRTEQNVIDSDGTLIISRGPLTGGTAYTVEMIHKHKKPFIFINLNETSELDAPSIISSWAIKQGIEVLNVAGPRASKDPGIYGNVRNILERIYHMGVICGDEDESKDLSNANISRLPESVDEAVGQIIAEMPLDERVKMARFSDQNLYVVKIAMMSYVREKLKESGINEALRKSCVEIAGRELDEVEASTVIIDELWERLKVSYGLRVVK